MSIVAYTGLPAAGKSYGVVENVIVPALESGRRVVTNVPMKADAVAAKGWPGSLEVVTLEQIKVAGWFAAVPGGAVVVLDEVWEIWPSGLKTVNVPDEQKAFLAKHRHRVGDDDFSMEVVLVTQDLGQIASFVRLLVQQTIRCTKLSSVGVESKYRVDFYAGAHSGQNPPESRRVRQTFGTYRAEIWTLYQSHTQSTGGGAGKEQRVDKRGSALNSWSIKYGLPLAAIMVCVGVWGGYRALRNPLGKPAPVAHTVAAPSRPASSSGSAVPSGSVPSSAVGRAVPLAGWRVAGWMMWSGRQDSARVVLVSDAGVVRVADPAALGCKVVQGGEGMPARDLSCEVDGDVATPWTGSSAARMLGWQGGQGTDADVARPAAGHSAPVPVPSAAPSRVSYSGRDPVALSGHVDPVALSAGSGRAVSTPAARTEPPRLGNVGGGTRPATW